MTADCCDKHISLQSGVVGRQLHFEINVSVQHICVFRSYRTLPRESIFIQVSGCKPQQFPNSKPRHLQGTLQLRWPKNVKE